MWKWREEKERKREENIKCRYGKQWTVIVVSVKFIPSMITSQPKIRARIMKLHTTNHERAR